MIIILLPEEVRNKVLTSCRGQKGTQVNRVIITRKQIRYEINESLLTALAEQNKCMVAYNVMRWV